MELCYRGHEEVCYEGGKQGCPVCAVIADFAEEKKSSAGLEVEISDQKDEIERLEEIIHELGQEEHSN